MFNRVAVTGADDMHGTLYRLMVLALALPVSVCLAAEPKIIKERRVFPEGDPQWRRPRRPSAWGMRLSPDGKRILYPRPTGEAPLEEQGRPRRKRRLFETVLRDLQTGKDTVLPIRPLKSAWRTAFTRSNSFSPDGKTLVLLDISAQREEVGKHTAGGGREARARARATRVRSKMRVVLYDIAAGKLVRTKMYGAMVVPTFDRTGKGLIVAKGSRQDWPIYTAALPELDPKPLAAQGLLHGACPTADVVCVWIPPKRVPPSEPGQLPQEGPQGLVLFDVKANKKIVDLPVHPRNRSLDDLETQWTPDGRYLYYYDVVEEGEVDAMSGRRQARAVTRIWDRVAGKPTGTVGDAVAVGPGPGQSLMVMAKLHGRQGGILLHDAKTGRDWQLAGSEVHLIHAWGKTILYDKPQPDGAGTAYVGEIAMPKAVGR